MLIGQKKGITFGNITKHNRIQPLPIIRQKTTGNIFHRDGLGEKRVYCNFDIKYELNTVQKTRGHDYFSVFSDAKENPD